MGNTGLRRIGPVMPERNVCPVLGEVHLSVPERSAPPSPPALFAGLQEIAVTPGQKSKEETAFAGVCGGASASRTSAQAGGRELISCLKFNVLEWGS